MKILCAISLILSILSLALCSYSVNQNVKCLELNALVCQRMDKLAHENADFIDIVIQNDKEIRQIIIDQVKNVENP